MEGEEDSSHVLKEKAKKIGHPSGKVYTMKTKPPKFLWKKDRVMFIRQKDKEINQKNGIVVLEGRIEGYLGISLFSSIC